MNYATSASVKIAPLVSTHGPYTRTTWTPEQTVQQEVRREPHVEPHKQPRTISRTMSEQVKNENHPMTIQSEHTSPIMQAPQRVYPKIETLQDLHYLPPISPQDLENLLHSQQLTLAPDGSLLRKHIYRVKRYQGGACGGCNRFCCGACDKNRCCGCCNDKGCCDRQRITFRRASGGSDASIWSTKTALKQKTGCC